MSKQNASSPIPAALSHCPTIFFAVCAPTVPRRSALQAERASVHFYWSYGVFWPPFRDFSKKIRYCLTEFATFVNKRVTAMWAKITPRSSVERYFRSLEKSQRLWVPIRNRFSKNKIAENTTMHAYASAIRGKWEYQFSRYDITFSIWRNFPTRRNQSGMQFCDYWLVCYDRMRLDRHPP